MAKKPKKLGLRIEMPEGWEPQAQTPGEPITLLMKDAAFQITIRLGAAEGEGVDAGSPCGHGRTDAREKRGRADR
jgi:hypothetical protein